MHHDLPGVGSDCHLDLYAICHRQAPAPSDPRGRIAPPLEYLAFKTGP